MKHQILAALLALSLSAPALAAPTHMPNHQRRDQVNTRLNRQNARIREGVKTGKLSHAQAHQMHEQVHAVHQQEKAEVKANGGHITKAQQHQLNGELNHQSSTIHNAKHP